VLLRLLFVSTLLFIDLFACQGAYSSCIAKLKDSHTIQESSLFIPVSKTRRLVFSNKKPAAKILKYDPFLSLYLIEEKFTFQYPFDFNMPIQDGTAIVTDKASCKGRFTQRQIGLNTFAIYSKTLQLPALITNSCCSIEGLLTQKGVIEKAYLKHFIQSKANQYADLGIRVQNLHGHVIITAVDPFKKNNPFKKADRVLAYDGKKIYNASQLMQKILFCAVGSKHSLKVKRGTSTITLSAVTQKRYGGGFVSDTFLESRGLYFDTNLELTKVSGSFQNYGLKNGDKLIQVNGVKVHTQKELRKNIENFKNVASLLFERNGFEFFVNIK